MKRVFFTIVLCVFCVLSFAQTTEALIRAAEQGNVNVQLFLARAYFKGNRGFPMNIQESYKWYLAAANQNNAEAQYEIAVFKYKLNGKWENNEEEEALSWIEKSADKGYAPAQEILGHYLLNNGQKSELGFHYIICAAQKGYPPAYSTLGDCFYYGQGTKRNLSEAKRYYQLAADAGIEIAYMGLGYCAREEGDYKNEKNYYQKAIDAGITDGYNDMAYLYAEGKGVPQDYNEAHRLIDIAISQKPLYPNYYDSKGEFYLMEGKMDKAREMWGKVLALDAKAEQRKDQLALAMMNGIDNNIPLSSLKSDKTFAIIIANENYKRVATVPFAKNDGNIFAEYCKKTLGIPEQNVYLVEDATLGDMKYHINMIKKIANAFNGEARVIFYYAGHGIPDESGKASYLLPIDGYGNDATSGYSLENLYTELANIPTKSTLVLLDACFSGAQRDGNMIANARGVTIKQKEETPTGKVIVFSAAQGDETAYPYTEKKHGMFTYYLLKKLQETKGDTTLGELINYVTTEVKQQSVLQNKKSQTPKVTVSPSMQGVWQNMKIM